MLAQLADEEQNGVIINNARATRMANLNDALFLIGSILFVGLSFNLIVITRNFDINYIIY